MRLLLWNKISKKKIDIYNKRWAKIISPELYCLSVELDDTFAKRDIKGTLGLIVKAKKSISDKNNSPSNMQLHYNIANAYATIRRLDPERSDIYIEKEIYSFRQVIDIFETNYSFVDNETYKDDEESTDGAELFVARDIAVRTYINLGNSLHSTGRYIASIGSFLNALMIEKDASMASMNLSSGLFEYGFFQNKNYESNYYYHAAYSYYKITEKYKYNLESQSYFDRFEENWIKPIPSETMTELLNKPLKLPDFEVKEENERRYRKYIASKRLFLEPCLDIFSTKPCFMVDSLSLPLDPGKNTNDDEFIELFNLLKQEFVSARYLWYESTVITKHEEHFSDKETDMVETGEKYILSLREIKLRSAFNIAYSIFDKIGFFINHYFNVGLKGNQISFKNIWKSELRDQRGNVYCTIPNPLNLKDNFFLNAIFWLQKDFYEDEKVNITSPSAIRLFQMRNDMVHNYLLSVERIERASTNITKYVTPYQIDDGTEKILKLARECLIYLTLAVGIEAKQRN